MKRYYDKVHDWLSSENSKYEKSGQDDDVWNVILDIQVMQCIHSMICNRFDLLRHFHEEKFIRILRQ